MRTWSGTPTLAFGDKTMPQSSTEYLMGDSATLVMISKACSTVSPRMGEPILMVIAPTSIGAGGGMGTPAGSTAGAPAAAAGGSMFGLIRKFTPRPSGSLLFTSSVSALITSDKGRLSICKELSLIRRSLRKIA